MSEHWKTHYRMTFCGTISTKRALHLLGSTIRSWEVKRRVIFEFCVICAFPGGKLKGDQKNTDNAHYDSY